MTLTHVAAGGREEWRRYWPLPLVAALGMAASVLFLYSIGPFIAPLHREFGWSRAQITSGILIANGLAAVFTTFVGIAVDRYGPRRIGLLGVCIMCGTVALLGTATGGWWDWVGHWLLIGMGSLTLQTTIWAGAVSSRFQASRGLAIAITMCGSGAAATAMPLVAAALIEAYGWRQAFFGVGGIWVLILLPPLVLFFRGAQDSPGRRAANAPAAAATRADLGGLTVREGFRNASFYKLMLSGSMFSFVLIATVVHFVPILIDRGRDAVPAAGIAGLIGLASIVGRLSTGLLLDRFRGDRVAFGAFLLPIAGMSLLIWGGDGAAVEACAAIIIGLSVGAELDVIAYLSTRYLGLKSYGTLFGAITSLMGAGTAIGPIAAGAVFDATGSYAPFLLAGIPAMVLGAVVLSTLGRYPDFDR